MPAPVDPQALSSLRLWQLISPALPVGAYAYSQGLEYAIDQAWLKTEADVRDWIVGQMEYTLANLDLAVMKCMYVAWQQDAAPQVLRWSRFLLANRESAEFQLQERQLGQALARLLRDLDIRQAQTWVTSDHASFAAMFSLAATQWGVPLTQALMGYGWAWAEGQVAAAVKLVPLGQTAGQRLLLTAAVSIVRAMEQALQIEEDEIGGSAPALGIASALHESQYSRLFRS